MKSRVALEPLAEEPGCGEEDAARRRSGLHAALHRWARLLSGGVAGDDARPAADLRVLLSVLACPLSPVPLLPRLPRHVRRVVGAVHHRAVQGHDGVREAGGRRRQEHVRVRPGAPLHAAGARRWGRRRARPRGELRAVAARAQHVARRDVRGRAERRRGQRRPRRLAPHALARRPRRARRLPPAPTRAPGPGPCDDRVHLLDGRARRREGGGRRGLLRAAPGRGAVGAVELERRNRGGDPARADGLLQPAQRAPGAAGGLAADPDPVPRRGRHVLGDHHRVGGVGLPRRGRRRGRRARGHVHGAPRPVRRGRPRRARRHADGGVVDHRRRGVQRAGARPGRLHTAGGGQEEPVLRRRHRRRQVSSLSAVSVRAQASV
uniref:Uncharacterized protein n=1 Tax=Zea mays TaxID=4577 RepID=A0A804LE99_MAIZE